jgi:hypothetical protein
MGGRKGNEDGLKKWLEEAMRVGQGDDAGDDGVVDDPVTCVAAPGGPLFFRDKAIGLEHKIREEVPEVQGQKEVVGRMHRFMQYL